MIDFTKYTSRDTIYQSLKDFEVLKKEILLQDGRLQNYTKKTLTKLNSKLSRPLELNMKLRSLL